MIIKQVEIATTERRFALNYALSELGTTSRFTGHVILSFSIFLVTLRIPEETSEKHPPPYNFKCVLIINFPLLKASTEFPGFPTGQRSNKLQSFDSCEAETGICANNSELVISHWIMNVLSTLSACLCAFIRTKSVSLLYKLLCV